MSEEQRALKLLEISEILAELKLLDTHKRPVASNGYAHVKSRAPNSKEYLQLVRQSVHEYHISDKRLKNLTQEWQAIEARRDEGNLKSRMPFLQDGGPNLMESPLEIFIGHLNLGYIPPVEVLIAIKHGFEKYYRAKSELELEEIFFGPRKPRAGNEAARKANNKDKEYFLFAVGYQRQKKRSSKSGNRPLSLEGFATEYLAKLGDTRDVYSFLKAFRRWKTSFLKN